MDVMGKGDIRKPHRCVNTIIYTDHIILITNMLMELHE